MAHFDSAGDNTPTPQQEEYNDQQLDDVSLGSMTQQGDIYPPAPPAQQRTSPKWPRQAGAECAKIPPGDNNQNQTVPSPLSQPNFAGEPQDVGEKLAAGSASKDGHDHSQGEQQQQQQQQQTDRTKAAPQGPMQQTRVLTGPLPPDFLRLMPDPVARRSSDQTGRAVDGWNMPTESRMQYPPNSDMTMGRTLVVEVIEGRMNKARGLSALTSRSLYCKLRVMSSALVTNTHENCGLSPYWGHCCRFILGSASPPSLFLEVFETGFFNDERVAWADVPVDPVYHGGEVQQRINVINKDGAVEGSIKLTMFLEASPLLVRPQRPVDSRAACGRDPPSQPTVQYPPGQQARLKDMAATEARAREEGRRRRDVESLRSMFPQFESDVIVAVYVANGNNVDQTVTALLAMGG